jgi:hypothetical protein
MYLLDHRRNLSKINFHLIMADTYLTVQNHSLLQVYLPKPSILMLQI